VVLPVSDGTLITGAGCWIKAHSPATQIIGVCPAAAPAVARSWRAGRVIRAEPGYTVAGSLVMREPAPEAVRRMREVVDDMVLVTDAALTEWTRRAASILGVLTEPSAAAGLAAIACHERPGTALATVLAGIDPDPAVAGERRYPSPPRERDWAGTRKAPGRSGVPSTWLTRLRCAA
jgi:threonine dehydratase